MSTTTQPFSSGFPDAPSPVPLTAADLQQRLGGIPLERIWLDPQPGRGIEQDVTTAHDRQGRLCELIDGVLVEKTMGYFEARLALVLARILDAYCEEHQLGFALGEGGTIKLMASQVRIPDVAFYSWARLPDRKIPREPIPELAPDLAVEILSTSNTKREMQRKLEDYFAAGVRLVWYIDAATRTASVYTAVDRVANLGQHDILDGGEVLPGFELELAELFRRVEP